jgi:hypothetical protein
MVRATFETEARAEAEAMAEIQAERERDYRKRLDQHIRELIGDGPPAGSGITPENWREWKLFQHVTCPDRAGRSCYNEDCMVGSRCWRMADRGLTGDGQALPRYRLPLCQAKTRAGGFCLMRVVPGTCRCRLHGGLSTGPKTEAGKRRISEGQKRRREWERQESVWRDRNLELTGHPAATRGTAGG